MHCYLCSLEARQHSSAIAVCTRCGAAICREHLVEILTTPSVGMGNDMRSRYNLLCCRCYKVATASTRLSQVKDDTQQPVTKSSYSGWRWWHWFSRGKPSSALPEPAEAITAVELFLKQQRKQ